MIKKFNLFENKYIGEIYYDYKYIIDSLCKIIFQKDFELQFFTIGIDEYTVNIKMSDEYINLKDYLSKVTTLYKIFDNEMGMDLSISKNIIIFDFNNSGYNNFITKLKKTTYKFIIDDLRKEKLKNKYKI